MTVVGLSSFNFAEAFSFRDWLAGCSMLTIEAQVIVEEMGAFGEDDALLITVMMQMQPFRNYLLESTAR